MIKVDKLMLINGNMNLTTLINQSSRSEKLITAVWIE